MPHCTRRELAQVFRGSGSLQVLPASWRLVTADTTSTEYSDAQLDDYQALSRRHFLVAPSDDARQSQVLP